MLSTIILLSVLLVKVLDYYHKIAYLVYIYLTNRAYFYCNKSTSHRYLALVPTFTRN